MKKGTAQSTKPSAKQKLAEARLQKSRVYKAELNSLVGVDVTSRLEDAPAANAEEVTALAEQMTTSMQRLFPGQERAWSKLFRVIDADDSGRLSYQEFAEMIRKKLLLTPQLLSESRMQGCWKSIDVDGSGFISLGEV